jgi:hypothetical protein
VPGPAGSCTSSMERLLQLQKVLSAVVSSPLVLLQKQCASHHSAACGSYASISLGNLITAAALAAVLAESRTSA